MITEPYNIWTAEYRGSHAEQSDLNNSVFTYQIEASIVYDIGPMGDMYEGVISVYVNLHGESDGEYSDALTFHTRQEAIDFLNECLNKWGFHKRLSPKDLLVRGPIAEAQANRRKIE